MDCPHFARTSFFLENPNIKSLNEVGVDDLFADISCMLSRKLFHNSHNTQSCQITSKLFHNFYNVATIQNSSKLDFVFSLHYIASLYARICPSFVLCSLRSAPSFSFILGIKKPQLSLRLFLWLPDLDSNQDKLHQKQSCYRYTIRQSLCHS